MKKRLVASKPRLVRFVSIIFLILAIIFVCAMKGNAQTKVETTSAPSCVEITGINIRPVLGLVAIDLSWVKAKGAGKMILVNTGAVIRVIQANTSSTYSDLLPHYGSVTITVFSGNETNECFSVTQIVETNLPD